MRPQVNILWTLWLENGCVLIERIGILFRSLLIYFIGNNSTLIKNYNWFSSDLSLNFSDTVVNDFIKRFFILILENGDWKTYQNVRNIWISFYCCGFIPNHPGIQGACSDYSFLGGTWVVRMKVYIISHVRRRSVLWCLRQFLFFFKFDIRKGSVVLIKSIW